MPRLVLLALVATLAGCTSTRIVEATDPAVLARVQARVVGREASVTLVSGDLYRGRIAYLRLDSTAWEEDAGVFAVPTEAVRLLVTDNRRRALTRGALIGAGAGFGLCFAAGSLISYDFGGDGNDNLELGLAVGAACVPGGLFYGLLGGAATGRRYEYVFVDPPPETDAAPPPETDAAPGPAE